MQEKTEAGLVFCNNAAHLRIMQAQMILRFVFAYSHQSVTRCILLNDYQQFELDIQQAAMEQHYAV